ncbi:MAG TPA: hypothetical protein VKW06_17800 [Candidatus Angelobacter sp.]|nr:hypothetical protein [Candidatus Angelobacter sp.]
MPVLLLFLAMIAAVFLPETSVPGVKIVSRQVTGGFSDTRTEYLTANRLRNEWQTHAGDRIGHPMASIIQRAGTNRVYLLDLQARQYVSYETDSQGVMLGAKSHSVENSGGTLQIWITSTDTGERQEMFGRMARHIVTTEKRVAGPGACSKNSDSQTDGWYIDDSVMPDWHHPKGGSGGVVIASVFAVNAGSACMDRVDKIEVHRSGVEPGFPLKSTTSMTSEVPSPDGTRMVASNWGSEVLEFKEGPLDPSLFEVPPGFAKVDALQNWYSPAPRRQVSGWDWLRDKLAEIFH